MLNKENIAGYSENYWEHRVLCTKPGDFKGLHALTRFAFKYL
jgi:hypothetical protein